MVRVNVTVAAGTVIAALLVAVADTRHPGQFVIMSAAGCAFLAVLARRGSVTRSEWFLLRVLLASNLLVFGLSYEHQLGLGLAVPTILSGALLLAVAIGARIGRRTGRRHSTDGPTQGPTGRC
jgi:hypothetical protein